MTLRQANMNKWYFWKKYQYIFFIFKESFIFLSLKKFRTKFFSWFTHPNSFLMCWKLVYLIKLIHLGKGTRGLSFISLITKTLWIINDVLSKLLRSVTSLCGSFLIYLEIMWPTTSYYALFHRGKKWNYAQRVIH